MSSPSRVSTPQTRRRGQPRGRSKCEPRETTPPSRRGVGGKGGAETTPPTPRGVGGKGGAKTESGSSPVTYAAAASSAVASPFISGGGGAASDQTGGSKTPGSSPAFSAASPSTASAAPHGGAPAAPPGGTYPGSEPITIDGRAYVGSFAIDLVFFHTLPQAEKDSIQLLRRLTTTPPSGPPSKRIRPEAAGPHLGLPHRKQLASWASTPRVHLGGPVKQNRFQSDDALLTARLKG